MFSRFKEALTNSLAPLDSLTPSNEPSSGANNHSVRRSASFTSSTTRTTTSSSHPNEINLKFPYCRPAFLNLTSKDEIQVTADHSIRPIIVPRGHGALPWNAGYAECINAGKSVRNEDQSALFSSTLKVVVSNDLAAKIHQLTTPSLLFKQQPSLTERKGGTKKSQSLHNFNNSNNHDSVNNEEDVKEEEVVVEEESKQEQEQEVALIPWTYFGMFDGHAGPGVAVAAAAQLHSVIGSKLERIAPLLLHFWEKEQTEDEQEEKVNGIEKNPQIEEMMKELKQEPITLDSLIKGCLESSFWDFDGQVERDKRTFCLNGGCTALAALFIFGKVYVANAGDSRAITVSKKNKSSSWTARAVSFDFTPQSERERVKMIALNKPELLGSTFTRLEFVRRPTRSDLGNQLLVRDAGMTGWTLKTITHSDLKFPLIFGSGKRSRVLGTIGVTRGFGDHELRAQFSDVYIKPFLTPQPQVQIIDCINQIEEDDEEVVLVMGTDGLWDVSSNERVADVVGAALDRNQESEGKGKRKELALHEDRYRFISAAQDLVMNSRGKLRQQQLNSLVVNGTSSRRSGWRTFEEKSATIDDISVFVIPLAPFARESREWREKMRRKKK